MALEKAEVILFCSKDYIVIKYNGTDKAIGLENIQDNMFNYLIMQVLDSIKELFFQMPIEKIDITYNIDSNCSNDTAVLAVYSKVLSAVNLFIQNTNKIYQEYRAYKGCAENYDKVLFYVAEDIPRLIEFYEYNKNLSPDKTILITYPSGWNPMQRCWENVDYKLAVSDLLDIITKQKIKKIVTVNYQFFENFFFNGEAIYLPPFLEFLDVEFVGIDHDPIEYFPVSGPLMRKLFQTGKSKRFTLAPSLHKYWDETYGINNIEYSSIIQHYKSFYEPIQLDEDYAVLVISNSRIKEVKYDLEEILFVLDRMDENSVMNELQLWYHSIRRFILEKVRGSDFSKMECSRYLNGFVYHASQFLKFEVVENINSNRKVAIFGDEGWGKLFPQYYQNRYLSQVEINDLNKENKYLYLLFNNAFSYLEASGSVFDAICKNTPFINLPALVKTELFKDFKNLEYNNKSELNYLIENASDVFNKEDINKSIRMLRDIYIQNEQDVAQQIILNKELPKDSSLFLYQLREHETILDRMVNEYIEQNQVFLIECIKKFFVNRDLRYNIADSRYFERNYFKQIISND